jgi:hypothetical protein
MLSGIVVLHIILVVKDQVSGNLSFAAKKSFNIRSSNEQDMFTLLKHLSSPMVFSEVHVSQSSIFRVVVCPSFSVFFSHFRLIIVLTICPFIYHFQISKLTWKSLIIYQVHAFVLLCKITHMLSRIVVLHIILVVKDQVSGNLSSIKHNVVLC